MDEYHYDSSEDILLFFRNSLYFWFILCFIGKVCDFFVVVVVYKLYIENENCKILIFHLIFIYYN